MKMSCNYAVDRREAGGYGAVVIAFPPAVVRRRQAFSLIEVVLALGIVGIAFIPLMGLLPVGLAASRGSMDSSVVSQIVQQIGADAAQADFEAIPLLEGDRYFDDQARELSAGDRMRSLYQARLVVAADADSPHLRRLIVQVVRNPGGTVAMTESGDLGLWQDQGALPIVTRSLLIARSSAAGAR